ncbi:MAG: putative RNA methyltransferase [Pseudomonadales bacterium]
MLTIICPVCRAPLAREERRWACLSGHDFDVAREGYVNLLPVQHRKSREPGDAEAMVRARRDFLSTGHYQPLRDTVLSLLRELAPASLLDIGCGEGYYTEAMATVVPQVIGLDIAKPAIRLAARRCKGPIWLVAGGARLPVGDASVDMITSLFSPLPVEEMARVLTPKGLLLVVTPAPLHLASVREALFDRVIAHEPEKFLRALSPQFICANRIDITFELTLSQAALRQLLLMTPYVWRARAERRAALEARPALETAAAFTLFVLRKAAAI